MSIISQPTDQLGFERSRVLAVLSVNRAPASDTGEPMGIQLRQPTIDVACDSNFGQSFAIRLRNVEPSWTSMPHDEADRHWMTLNAATLAIRKPMAILTLTKTPCEVAKTRAQLITAACPIGAMPHVRYKLYRYALLCQEDTFRTRQLWTEFRHVASLEQFTTITI